MISTKLYTNHIWRPRINILNIVELGLIFNYDNDNNNGPNGHLFYVGGDLMMRGMLPIIMLPDGDLRIVMHLVPF